MTSVSSSTSVPAVTQRKRVLWLSHFVPFPPKGGCFQRSYNLIKRVAASHDVHLVAVRHKSETHPGAESAGARAELLRHCRSVDIVDISESTRGLPMLLRAVGSVMTLQPLTVTIFRSRELRERIGALMSQHAFDAAHFDTISLAQYLPDVGAIPCVMTHHGAESFMIRRRIGNEANPIRKLFFAIEWLTLERYEARMCPKFSRNVVMSALDQEILARVAPAAAFTVVPNGVDIDYFRPVAQVPSRSLIFAGRLDQYSNRHGMLRFMQHAWPLIVQKYPDTHIDIIGSNPPPEIQRMAESDSRVRVHGFVPDVRTYFEKAAVAICPIWDGGGTRIKVLDGLAQGMPLVATSIGAEGIDVVKERDLLLADTPEEFARQIGRLFDDAELRSMLSRNGRALTEAVYSWDSIANRLSALYGSRPSPAPPSL